MVEVKRTTSESRVVVRLKYGLSEKYREKIKTPIQFLNHMIEHIAWRSNCEIEAEVELARFELDHLVCEDTGMALGRAFSELLVRQGGRGYATETAIIDEARALTAVSFENRGMTVIESRVEIPERTEGINSEDLKTFLEGFAIGACCTLQVEICRGENGHHIWEAVYRALGQALGVACAPSPEREGRTSGVAGKITYEVE